MPTRRSLAAIAAMSLVAACAGEDPTGPAAARAPREAPLASLVPAACANPTVTWTGTVDAQGRRVINGTSGNDVIVGTAGSDLINGLQGDDIICAGAGNDFIYGGPGQNQLFGEAGDDRFLSASQPEVSVFSGGEGVDAVYPKAPGGTTVIVNLNDRDWNHDGDASTPAIRSSRIVGGHMNGSSFARTTYVDGGGTTRNVADVENVIHDSPNTPLMAWGGWGPNRLVGGNASDLLDGFRGDDVILAGSGDDVVRGDEGDDVLYLGEGDDEATGGSGDDLIVAGAGNDRANGGDGNDVFFGEDGDDHYFLGSNSASFADEFYGGNGRDRANDGSANDVIGYDPTEDDDRTASQNAAAALRTPDPSSTLGGNVKRAPRAP